jgi:hypothetical protein
MLACLSCIPTSTLQQFHLLYSSSHNQCSALAIKRETPGGRTLQGRYGETRWKYGELYRTSGQWFVEKVSEFVARIEPHKAFLKELRSGKGTACLVIEFLGDGYFGDELPRDLLRRLADLELNLGIECFTVPQSDWL